MAAAATANPAVNTSGLGGSSQSQSETPQMNLPVIEEVEWDWTCSMPLPYLTHILKCYVPEWNPVVGLSDDFKQTQNRIRKQLEDSYKGVADMKVIVTGSFFENLSLPPFYQIATKEVPTEAELEQMMVLSDVGMMIEAGGKLAGHKDQAYKEPYLYHIETKKTNPGYLRLVLPDSSTAGPYNVKVDGKVYVSSSKLRAEFVQTATVMTLLEDPGIKLDSIGTALSVYRSHDSPAQTLISFACPVWPKEAQEWVKRERPSGWPSEQLRKQIINAGCHVIPEAHHKSSCKEVEWKYSFAEAEKKLSQSLTLVQRQCYMMLNAILKFQLAPPNLVTSNCIKNLFFWSMERIPQEQWNDDINGLGATFLCLLDEVMYSIINDELPHYFIKQNNLIDHIPEDFSQELMSQVSKMRRDPLKYLLDFDKVFKMTHSAIRTNFSAVFNDMIEDCKKYHNSMQRCQVVKLQTCNTLLEAHLQDSQYKYGYGVSQDACKVLATLGDDRTPEIHMESLMLKLEPKHAISAYEYLFGKDPDLTNSQVHVSMLGNMACMYTSLYCTETDDSLKEEYKKKADENFQKALNREVSRAATGVDYTVFLCACGRQADAIPLLTRILTKDSLQDGNSNMYDKSEYPSLDDHIRAEVDCLGEISAPSLIWAFYYMAHCYLVVGNRAEAVAMMADFAAACGKFPKQHLVFSLLGYAYMDQENHQLAAMAFQKAIDILPTYQLANNNKDLCTAMAMSLSVSDDA